MKQPEALAAYWRGYRWALENARVNGCEWVASRVNNYDSRPWRKGAYDLLQKVRNKKVSL